MVIFDSTILIEISRGNEDVKKNVVEMSPPIIYISSITVAEFMVGARDKSDMLKIKGILIIIHFSQSTRASTLFS